MDVFNDIIAEGYRVDYLRIPITDEQAPIPKVFDELVDRLLSVSSDGIPLFNCQMGRGRTTTGMVVACLMQMIIGNRKSLVASSAAIQENESSQINLEEEAIDSLRYLSGEYVIILQVISVLHQGKVSKMLTDQAIDACADMQNLRSCINDYRARLANLVVLNPKYKLTFDTACNYLVRYFYLIVYYSLNQICGLPLGAMGRMESRRYKAAKVFSLASRPERNHLSFAPQPPPS